MCWSSLGGIGGGNKLMPEYGFLPVALVTDYLRSYKAAARNLGVAHLQQLCT
jgi:hypothetical protein